MKILRQQVRQIQKLPLDRAVQVIQILCREAYEEGIREGEKEYEDAIIIETDEETAEKIREEVERKKGGAS